MTETAEFVRKPATPTTETVTDSLGRVLTIRRLDAVAEMDLIEAAGELAENRKWMMVATLAACVVDIDGSPTWPLKDKRSIRSRVKDVGSEGLSAVMDMLRPEEAEIATDATNAQAAAKN